MTTYLNGGYCLAALGANGGKQRVVVVDAVNFGIHVDGEGDAVQALVADAAAEAARVVRLPHGLQDLLSWELLFLSPWQLVTICCQGYWLLCSYYNLQSP